MAGENTAKTQSGSQAPVDQVQADPWAAAFAALEQKDEKDSKADSANGSIEAVDTSQANGSAQGREGANSSLSAGNNSGFENSAGNDTSSVTDNANTEQGDSDQGMAGGLDSGTGESGELGEQATGNSDSDFTEQDLEEYRELIVNDIRDRVAQQVNQEFIKQGVMSYNGVVGANINDERICKRDSDGVPHFYNPETGREFTGDNPRQQAQDYCRSYNEELEQAFNRACAQMESKFATDEATELAVLEFAPTYEKMDPVRQRLFDDIVSDYEIKDNSGEIIGYNCDLNRAAATVERMVASIQSFAPKQEDPGTNSAPQSGGPVLDMPNRAAAVTTQPGSPKSLEEALMNYQNNLLDSRKK